MLKPKKKDITEEQELEIWNKLRSTGEAKYRDLLVHKYAPLVNYVAGKIKAMLPNNHIEYDDLVGFGSFGLLDAINKFDYTMNVHFKTYAVQRINGQIYDELRKLDWVPRSVREKFKQMEIIRADYLNEHKKAISDEELSEKMSISLSEVKRISKVSYNSNVTSINIKINANDQNSNTIEDTLEGNEKLIPDNVLQQKDIQNAIAKEIKKLSEIQQKVLILCYYEDLTLKEIGVILGVTESRVCQIRNQAIENIQEKLNHIKNTLL